MSARRRRPSAEVNGGTFVVVASGFADGPAQPLVRFLNQHGARRVAVVTHPLVAEGPSEHRVDTYVHGIAGRRRTRRRPNRPPFTYLFDPITPLRVPRADVWFGFNCLATAQGLLLRRLGRVGRVVHWNVDFVPNRFGSNPMTRIYEWLDRRCVMSSDGRVELSDSACHNRLLLYRLSESSCPAEIVPMGAWTNESPKANMSNLDAPRLVFLGHLVERMGVPIVLDVVAGLRKRGLDVHADIVGGGPLEATIRQRCLDMGLAPYVTVHGFVSDFGDVQPILASAAVALAPYETDESSFSRFADPGKLKAYLGAGLPIVMTSVPPNACEIEAQGGAILVESSIHAFVEAVESLILDRDRWIAHHSAALEYSLRFDWEFLLGRSLPRLGVPLASPGPASDEQ